MLVMKIEPFIRIAVVEGDSSGEKWSSKKVSFRKFSFLADWKSMCSVETEEESSLWRAILPWHDW